MSVTSGQYVAGKGLACPSCESGDIGSVDGGASRDDASYTIGVHCNACRATWTERYVLVSYFDLEEGAR